MSDTSDLRSLLSVPQRKELLLAVVKISHSMREQLQKEDTAPATTSASEKSVPSLHLAAIQEAAVKSFDIWRDTVLSHISEALNTDTPPSTNDECTPLTTTQHPDILLASLLHHLLTLKSYDARTRILLHHLAATLHLPPNTLPTLESETAHALLSPALSAPPPSSAPSNNRWKIGLASAAGAAIIGVSGGLAAPLVAAGIGSLGLGAGVLGSSVVVGTLFGGYGGRISGQAMARYVAEVEDFSFLPLGDGAARLRVGVGVTGWVVDGEKDVVRPWSALGGGLQAYALRYEMDVMQKLGNAVRDMVGSYAKAWVKKEIVKRTVFATLYSALWPLGLMKFARVVDNPFSMAKARSEKAGRVLADALVNKVQGERPVTLVGFSLGARVVYFCLLSLAERGAFGIVENVVLMGAAVPASEDTWGAMRKVVAGRLVNVYSAQDWVLAFLYRTSSIQLGVAGLQEVKVMGVENVDVGEKVDGHLKYSHAVGSILRDVLPGDVVIEVAEREEEVLKGIEEEERRTEEVRGGEMNEDDIERVVEKVERELEEKKTANKDGS